MRRWVGHRAVGVCSVRSTERQYTIGESTILINVVTVGRRTSYSQPHDVGLHNGKSFIH